MNMSADESKTALIVIGNSITEGRLQMVLRKRGWTSEVVKDGDKAVDDFVALRPDLVFIAVDIPTLDGHVAALEMRESDPKARIVFVSSRGRIDLGCHLSSQVNRPPSPRQQKRSRKDVG